MDPYEGRTLRATAACAFLSFWRITVMNIRTLALASTDYKTRTEVVDGRSFLVVPVIALVEGAVHAMNAKAPEFVAASEFEKTVGMWEGLPVYESHPLDEKGAPVSGAAPEVLATKAGIVRNATMKDGKLAMEAWLDEELAAVNAPKLLARAKAGTPIEISVGVFVEPKPYDGIYNGKRVAQQWTNIHPDHLALLKETEVGACSIEMGCGVRAAKGAVMTEEFKNLRDIPMNVLENLDDEDFAGPNRSFPIAEPGDIAAAAHAIGRAKGDRTAIKKKIVGIAYRKGEDYVAKLPEGWKKKSDQKNASLFAKMMQAAQGIFRNAQDADEMSSDDLKRKLYDAVKEVEANLDYVVDYFPVTDPTHVVYCVSTPVAMNDGYGDYVSYTWKNYERAFELSKNGVVTLQAARVEVKTVTKYEPVEGAQPQADFVSVEVLSENITAAETGAPSTDADTPDATITTTGEEKMKIEDVIKFLSGATDCDKKAVQAALGEPEVKVETKVEKVFDLELAPAEVKAAVAAQVAAATAKKNTAIKALKDSGRNKFTDEQLQAKSQDELDALVSLVGEKETATTGTRAAVDFSAQGAAKTGDDKDAAAPPALDMAASVRAARGIK